jgi:hypothetical protein
VVPEIGPNGRLHINGKPLVCVHHHFFKPDKPMFHRVMRYMLLRSPAHARVLRLIDYVDYDFDLNLLYDPSFAAMQMMSSSGRVVCFNVQSLVLLLSVLYVAYAMCRRGRPIGGVVNYIRGRQHKA